MITKEDLIKELQKDSEKYWKVELFDELGFKRKRCKNCGKFFWTLTEQEVCNDSSCREYEFIGKPLTKRKLNLFETWKEIEKFFVSNGHTLLKPYPIVCRWFPLYFTIAGIVDFYRMSDDKLDFEFPANPSILIQPCLRFNDLPNVGLNSRSYSCFFMVQQSSLFEEKKGYWKNECINLDFQLLTKVFGIKPEEIVFIEDVWLGPNAFGPSLEYHVKGLELGNAVFTEFEIKNNGFVEMEKKVIDMGAGLERFCWITQGSLTSYDSVFGSVVEKMKEICGLETDEILEKYFRLCGKINVEESSNIEIALKNISKNIGISVEKLKKKIEPFQALYSIADHSRGLVFAISDGGIPSNTAGGYNLRVILRRALSFIDKFNWNFNFVEICFWHIEELKKLFPNLEENKKQIEKVLEVEIERYKQAKERSKRLVESYIKSGKIPTQEELVKLYDSEGITPEQLKDAGLKIEIPPDFYSKITEMHMKEKQKEEKIPFELAGIPETKLLFYEDPNLLKFKAKVLKNFENWVVLDQTAFYPTSGGQLHDKGFIDGLEVLDVQKIGKIIIHKLPGKVEEGKVVECEVDGKRREILRRHHTATHIVNYSSRKVLGKHVWQYGAEKSVEKARLDITHFQALSEEEIEKIEKIANEIVDKDFEVKIEVLPRGEAEKKYGFIIYQGGPLNEKNVRIVSFGEEHEACGGLHCFSTKEVGPIIILRTKRIADGIVRIEFCSGEVSLNYLKESEKILEEVSKILNCKYEDVPEAVERLFKVWKKKMKELKKLEKNIKEQKS